MAAEKHYFFGATADFFEAAAAFNLSWQFRNDSIISLGRVNPFWRAKSNVESTLWLKLPDECAAALDVKMRAAVLMQHVVKIRLTSELAK
jgi:hypothetical protein